MLNIVKDYIGHLDDTFGRYFFKNNCGITGNFSGKLGYFLAKRSYEGESKNLETINYLDYEYDEGFIDDFSNEARKLLRNSEDSIIVSSEKGNEFKRMLRSPYFDFDQNLPNLASFFPDQVVNEISSYLKSDFKVVNAQILELQHNDIDLEEFSERSTEQFHSDPYSSDAFRYFVFLDDVDENDGQQRFLTVKIV